MNTKKITLAINTACFLVLLVAGSFLRLDGLARRMTHVDDIGWLMSVSPEGGLATADAVSKSWTYGPAQFLAAHYFIQGAESWDDLLLHSRLPSALSSVVGLAVFLFVLLKWRGSLLDAPALVPAALLVFGLRGIIESQQAYPYAGSLFFMAALFLVIGFYRPKQPKFECQKVLIESAVLGLACNYNYQFYFMFVSYMVFVLWSHRHTLKFDRLSFRLLTSTVGVFFLLSAPVFFTYALAQAKGRVPRWTAQDVLPFPVTLSGVLTHIVSTLGKLFSFTLTPVFPASVAESTWLVDIGLVAFGVVSYLSLKTWWLGRRGSAHPAEPMVQFAWITIAAWIVLNLLRFFPLGSTRHSYILITPILIIISDALYKVLSVGRISKVIGAGLATFIAIVVCLHRGDFELRSRNNVAMPVLLQHVKEDHPRAVISYGWTWDYFVYQKFFGGDATAEAILTDDGFDPAPVFQSLKIGECAFLMSHEAPRQNLLPSTPDFVVQPLAVIAPFGSTELAGQINGGNGFTLLKVSRVH